MIPTAAIALSIVRQSITYVLVGELSGLAKDNEGLTFSNRCRQIILTDGQIRVFDSHRGRSPVQSERVPAISILFIPAK